MEKKIEIKSGDKIFYIDSDEKQKMDDFFKEKEKTFGNVNQTYFLTFDEKLAIDNFIKEREKVLEDAFKEVEILINVLETLNDNKIP